MRSSQQSVRQRPGSQAARCSPPRRLPSSRRVLGSDRSSSPESAPSYPRLSLSRWAACPLPQPRSHTPLSILPSSGFAGGWVEKALRSPHLCLVLQEPCPPGPTSGRAGPGATAFLPGNHLGNSVTLSIGRNNQALLCK